MSSVWPQYTKPSCRTHTYTHECPTVSAGGVLPAPTTCTCVHVLIFRSISCKLSFSKQLHCEASYAVSFICINARAETTVTQAWM